VSDRKLTNDEEAALWRLARRQLEIEKLEPAVSSELADRLRAQLPARRENETLGDLIRRASANTRSTAEVKSFKPKSTRRYKPLAEFVRLAADTGETELPLPDPASELESADGRFRLRVMATDDGIDIYIQALGFAADEFANCRIGLAGPDDGDEPVAVVTLDQDGDGNCRIEDTPRVRRALLKPVIVLVA